MDEEEWLASVSSSDRRRREIDDPYLHRLQGRHFLLFDVLPGVATIAALALLFVRPIGAMELSLFGVMWLLTGIGISAGYHRLFTHRSWEAAPVVRVSLAILGCMAGQGPVISWAAIHRRHHERTDREGDMHSPNLHGPGFEGRVRGFIHAHFMWMRRHPYANVAVYVPELLRDRALVWVGRNYHVWVIAGLALPAVIGGAVSHSWWGALSGFLWGGMVRMFVVGNSIWALNSVLHSVGSRRFVSANDADRSRNSWILALLVWGEGWHHNHHSFPASASFGLEWFHIDISYGFIRLLEVFGLAWDIRVPTRERIAQREARVHHQRVAAALAPTKGGKVP